MQYVLWELGASYLHEHNNFKYADSADGQNQQQHVPTVERRPPFSGAAYMPYELQLTTLERESERGQLQWGTLVLFPHMDIPAAAAGTRVQTADRPWSNTLATKECSQPILDSGNLNLKVG
jgi:hypothetical protein